jgi:hypothetical protein
LLTVVLAASGPDHVAKGSEFILVVCSGLATDESATTFFGLFVCFLPNIGDNNKT